MIVFRVDVGDIISLVIVLVLIIWFLFHYKEW